MMKTKKTPPNVGALGGNTQNTPKKQKKELTIV